MPCHHHTSTSTSSTNRLRRATMTQQRCNTPGGIDRNESMSQQSRMNKNKINKATTTMTNSTSLHTTINHAQPHTTRHTKKSNIVVYRTRRRHDGITQQQRRRKRWWWWWWWWCDTRYLREYKSHRPAFGTSTKTQNAGPFERIWNKIPTGTTEQQNNNNGRPRDGILGGTGGGDDGITNTSIGAASVRVVERKHETGRAGRD